MSKESKTYKNMSKKVYIRTFGCQMNFRDSEHAMGLLLDCGFRQAESIEEADIALFNTCSVRRHAEERACNNIWNLQGLKQKKPEMIVGVVGCMAQAKGEEIFEKLPHVDFICGPDNEQDLPRLIEDVLKDRASIAALGNIGKKIEESFPEYRDEKLKAFVSISRGCDNFCSYCIVPFVRGRERSREPGAILREIRDLAKRDFKEITLLGQNVNSYNGYSNQKRGVKNKRRDFIRLLEDINKINGIERIRFITSHPKDASKWLFEAMRDLSKVCEHLHLPVQSGSDKILKLMNRGYSAKAYLSLVDDYRRLVPQGSLTADIIVGFPSETKRDFEKTQDLIKRIEFDSAFVFKYSPRPPARASLLKDDVPEDVKSRRNNELLGLQYAVSKKRNKMLIGSRQEVLFEGMDKKSGRRLTGRTRSNKIVIAPNRNGMIGKLSEVKVEEVTCQTLKGKIAK